MELGARGDGCAAANRDLYAAVHQFGKDLLSHLAAMDIDLPWEVKGQPDAVSLERRDAHHTDRIGWVADDDLLALSSCDHQHTGTPVLGVTCIPDPPGTIIHSVQFAAECCGVKIWFEFRSA